MDDKDYLCKNCGKRYEYHTVARHECPCGRKHRSIGYTQYGPSCFDPDHSKPIPQSKKPKIVI